MKNSIACAAIVGAITSSSFAGIIHVPGDAQTIQIAISQAQPFDTIIVAPGTYFEAISFGGKVITVQSSNPTNPATVAATIINAGGLGSVVTFSGGEDQVNTILDGFTITGGTKGIDGHNTKAIVRRCVVRSNSGGGIIEVDGVIEDCNIRDNNGDGLSDCDGPVRRCLISNNQYQGIVNCDGLVSDCVIEKTRQGVGIANGTGTALRCIITENGSGGIRYHTGMISQSMISKNIGQGIDQGSGLVENCLISGNSGVGVNQSSKVLHSCTITGNRNHGIAGQYGAVKHTILWDNFPANIQSSQTTPQFSGTANPFFVQPGFWDNLNNVWVDGDYHLSQNSPYIDAGDPFYLMNPSNPLEDIDGNPRVVGARIDIGAYEFQAECTGEDFDSDGTADICDPDIDDDGITNVTDVCDDTPSGITVDFEGRPAADLDHDCSVDLLDYAIFQRDVFGP